MDKAEASHSHWIDNLDTDSVWKSPILLTLVAFKGINFLNLLPFPFLFFFVPVKILCPHFLFHERAMLFLGGGVSDWISVCR